MFCLHILLPAAKHTVVKYNKKLSYRKETVRLHDITSSVAVAEKKHSRVGQFEWVLGDVHMKVSVRTASRIGTRLVLVR